MVARPAIILRLDTEMWKGEYLENIVRINIILGANNLVEHSKGTHREPELVILFMDVHGTQTNQDSGNGVIGGVIIGITPN